MINLVPQALGLQPNGSPDDQLHQALLSRKKAQAGLSGGQALTKAAASTDPVYSKAHGYAKLLAGALGGFMQGQEAKAQADQTKAGIDSGAELARTYGMSPEQVSKWKGFYMLNPTGAMDLLKQHQERTLKPDDKSWGVTGQDFMGRPTYGFINTTQGTIARPGNGMPQPNGAPSIGPSAAPPANPYAGPPALGSGAGFVAPPAAPPSPPSFQGPQMPTGRSGGSPPSAPLPAGMPLGGAASLPRQDQEDGSRRAQLSGAGYPTTAPLPPPGVDPKTFYEEWSKSQTSTTLPPKPDDVTGVRKEVQNLPSYKNMAQAAPIYRSMYEAAGRNNKAADLNLVYGLGKIMDPGSVVREGEMVLVKNTAALPEWLQGKIAALNGGGELTPETRKNIMDEAHGRMGAYKQMFDQDMQQYRGVVERGRMNLADVVPDFGAFDRYDPAGPPIPADIAQRQAVPGGAAAAMPDGITREMLQAEMLRRQQEMQAQQEAQRYTDPMGGRY